MGGARNIASIAKVGGRADISESPAARYEQGFGAKQPYSFYKGTRVYMG